MFPGSCAKAGFCFGGADLDAAEPADEVRVPVLAPEFAVGDDLEAGPFLAGDRVANRRILDRAQSRCRRSRRAPARRGRQSPLAGGADCPRGRPGKTASCDGHGGTHRGAAICRYGRTGLPRAQRCRAVRELSASVPVQAPSGFALAFLNTYVSDLTGAGGAIDLADALHGHATRRADARTRRDRAGRIHAEARRRTGGIEHLLGTGRQPLSELQRNVARARNRSRDVYAHARRERTTFRVAWPGSSSMR